MRSLSGTAEWEYPTQKEWSEMWRYERTRWTWRLSAYQSNVGQGWDIADEEEETGQEMEPTQRCPVCNGKKFRVYIIGQQLSNWRNVI